MIYVLILVMSMGVSYVGVPPTDRMVVGSPEAAAVELWKRQQQSDQWTHWHGELWSVELEAGRVRKIEIPKVSFTIEPPA